MAAGLPGPAVYEIPVKQIAVETYLAVYEHRHRIARWAIVPLILCVVLILVENGIKASGTGNVYFALIFSLIFAVLVLLVTVPYQVAIHRLTYPGFDFDQGLYGPPLKTIHNYYLSYTIFLSVIPVIILTVLYFIGAFLNIGFLLNLIFLVFVLFYIYFLVGLMLVFPQMAVGVKPDLMRVWWMLKGNVLRLILTIILTTAPVYFLSIIPIVFIHQLGPESFFLNAVQAVIDSAFSLLITGLWATTLSICYFNITGRQPLAGGSSTVSEDPETT